MKTININISDISIGSYALEGVYNELQIIFGDIPEEWQGNRIYATFVQDNLNPTIEVIDNAVAVPLEILKTGTDFYVSVYSIAYGTTQVSEPSVPMLIKVNTIESNKLDIQKLAEVIVKFNAQIAALTSGKVDKEDSKGLSSNNYSNEDKEKVDSLSEVAFSGSFKDIKNAPMEDLGVFHYIYNGDTDESTVETTSTKYKNYSEALDNTKETGIYIIEYKYTDIFEGEDNTNQIESSILFVAKGKSPEADREVVHQMIFDNYTDMESTGSIFVPRIRTYANNKWSKWYPDEMNYDCFNGIESASNKVKEIEEKYSDYEGNYNYPTVYAVINYVKDKINGIKPELTDAQKEKIDNAIQKNPYIYEAGLTALYKYYPDEEYSEGDVQYEFGEDIYYIEQYTSDNEECNYAEFYDAETVARRILALNPKPITTKPTTLEAAKKYNFGEVAELNLAFPTDANDGDVIYLTFTSGATATNLTIDTTNTCDIEVIPETNTGYEIFGMFNGSIWIINYSEYTVSEV